MARLQRYACLALLALALFAGQASSNQIISFGEPDASKIKTLPDGRRIVPDDKKPDPRLALPPEKWPLELAFLRPLLVTASERGLEEQNYRYGQAQRAVFNDPTAGGAADDPLARLRSRVTGLSQSVNGFSERVTVLGERVGILGFGGFGRRLLSWTA